MVPAVDFGGRPNQQTWAVDTRLAWKGKTSNREDSGYVAFLCRLGALALSPEKVFSEVKSDISAFALRLSSVVLSRDRSPVFLSIGTQSSSWMWSLDLSNKILPSGILLLLFLLDGSRRKNSGILHFDSALGGSSSHLTDLVRSSWFHFISDLSTGTAELLFRLSSRRNV